MSIPTLLLFRNGEAVAQTIGVQPKEQIEKLFYCSSFFQRD